MTPVGFVLLLVSYVALGLLWKSAVLNWVVGPLYPLAVVYLLPRLLSRLLPRRRPRRP